MFVYLIILPGIMFTSSIHLFSNFIFLYAWGNSIMYRYQIYIIHSSVWWTHRLFPCVVKKEPMKIGEHVCLYWAKEFFGCMLMCCTVESHGRYLSGFWGAATLIFIVTPTHSAWGFPHSLQHLLSFDFFILVILTWVRRNLKVTFISLMDNWTESSQKN